MERSHLRVLLERYHVPLHKWGKGKAKTLDHLFSALTAGEMVLGVYDEKLLASSEGSILNVYYDDSTTIWLLKEEKQVFKDGRSRTRTLNVR